MKKSIIFLTLLLSFSFTVFSAEKCPVDFGNEDYLGKVAQLATDSGSCYEASEIVNACALGASGDVFTVSAAIARCEKDMPKMSRKDAKMYASLNKKCTDKYASTEGTLYRSMNAFCHLSVASLFNSLLSTESL